MNTASLQEEILRRKKERGVAVLAHSYQAREICEIADITGDSFRLAQAAQELPEETILLCGVRFMAETAKLLNPSKRVLLSHPDAGCPMADQWDGPMLREAKAAFPGYAVVAYVNTTAETKAESDVCVTSSSAVAIVRKLPEHDILFIPDCNLGAYVAAQVPEKNVKTLHGGCPTHARMTLSDVRRAREAHPAAEFLVHPECPPAVVACADFVGSTAAILKRAKESPSRDFIIGTENSIAEHLAYDCPEKNFFVLSKQLICPNMKLTTLPDVLRAIEGRGGEDISIPADIEERARRALERMLALG